MNITTAGGVSSTSFGRACRNDLVALGMPRAVTRYSFSLPDDVATVGYDDIEFVAAAAVPLSSVRQPRQAAGQMVARLLMSELLLGQRCARETRTVISSPFGRLAEKYAGLLDVGRYGASAMPDGVERLAAAFSTLLDFLADEPLTARVGHLEHALDGSVVNEVPHILDAHAVNVDLLRSALLVSGRLGRIDDLIHATAIALPRLLAPGEILRRPSLAAGNDPSRPFDLETDRRVAEFKLARWKGKDAERKRQVFKDLVHLAADQSGRTAELYVPGQRPIQFLRGTRSLAAWALDKSSTTTRALFSERFGSLDIRVADFVAGPGSRVEIIDLEQRLPDVFAPLP